MGLLDDAIREHLELKRRHGADPDEVARLMVWLASDESSYITGTEQVVDAGLTAQ